ncbi:MAG: rod shape-determining protein MreD [Gallionellales bacterium GWA2_60_142]|nr:MAG: rod shape-determining protein MreD [Gallionellales bacterium GWA2_60_142]HCI13965.1 rod shape-determining protein MreD [Gallionellaceae bacterium]
MPYLSPSTPELQRPVSNTFIVTSILVALFLNALPWEGLWLALRPDFVALVMLYWCTHAPLRVGIGLSWAAGMLADVADSSLFGQHALAYTLLAFGGVVLHRRLQMFDLREQTTQVLGIFAVTYAVYALVHWQVSGYMMWSYLLGCLTSTLLWAPLSIMFRAMRQARVERE